MMRWWAWLIAYWGGYFWLPCSMCGRGFGGQEGNRDPWIVVRGRCVCPRCARKLESLCGRLSEAEMIAAVQEYYRYYAGRVIGPILRASKPPLDRSPGELPRDCEQQKGEL